MSHTDYHSNNTIAEMITNLYDHLSDLRFMMSTTFLPSGMQQGLALSALDVETDIKRYVDTLNYLDRCYKKPYKNK
jgi:hypothetical protein